MIKPDTSLRKRFNKLFWLLPLVLVAFSTQLYAQETVVLDEELRDGSLPDGWTASQIDFRTAAGGYALFEDAASVLQTPVLDLGEFDSVTLFFDVAKFGSGGDGPLTVQVSNDGGTTWTAQEYDSPIPTDATYLTSEQGITVSGDNVVIRWIRENSPSGKRLRDVQLVGFTDVEPGLIGPFSLLSPPNNARVAVYEGDSSEIVIDWEDADGAETYMWVANAPGEGFDEPLLEIPSDDSGTASMLTITKGTVYNALSMLGVDEGTSVELEWTVIAQADSEERLANQIWSVNFAAPVLVSSIGEFRDGDSDVIYAIDSEVTFLGGDGFRNRKFLDDGELGILVDDQPGRVTTEYTPGDGITRAVGTLVVFNGQNQLSAWTDFGEASSAGNPVEPIVLSLEELQSDFPTYQSRLVQVTNVAFTEDGNFSNGTNYDLVDADDSSIEGFFRTDFFNRDYIGDPIPQDPLNITGFTLTRENTINLVVARDSDDFEVLSDEDQVATPSFDPSPGTFPDEVTVSISTSTPDATIYYTVNGTEPTTDSEVYDGPLTFTETTTLSAFAVADGFTDSDVVTGEYVIEDVVTITTIAELRQQENMGTVTFSGEAILTFQQDFRNQKFIQDETGGILIDDAPAGNFNPGVITTEYEVGDALTGLTGTVSVFGNMVQFVPAEDPGAPVSSGNEVEPLEISLDELYSDFDLYQSRLVTVTGVVFPEASGNFANGQVYDLQDIDDPSIDGLFRSTFFGVDYIGTAVPSVPQNITGLPNSRADGDYLTARNQADFETFSSDDQVAAPSIEPASGLYTEPVEVTMSVEDDQATITYTLNGSEPTEGSTEYTGPFTVDETTIVQARAFRPGFEPSSVVSATYNFPVEVNLAEARELEIGTAVRVTGLITTPDFGFNNAEFYIQDEVGGIKVRWAGFGGGNDPDTPFAEGQEVELVGTIDQRFQEILVAPVEFDVLSEGNPLPEPTPIEDYDAQWTIDSSEQGRRVTMLEVSLVDPSQWPVDPIGSGSGLTVQAVDADGNIYDIRIDRDESFFDGSPVPPAVFNLTGVLGQFEDNAQIFPFYEDELEEVLQDPLVQIIHNAADPALASVDIYINGDLAFGGVDFRSATESMMVPGDEAFTVSITSAGDELEDALYEAEVTLDKGESYYIIAQGVIDESAFDENPDGISIGFELDIIEGAVFESSEPTNFEFAIYHGVTDAPAVDVVARDLALLAGDLSYTDVTEDYISISADAYILDINAAGTGTTVASFNVDLSPLQGQIGLVLASGFLNAEQGESFGLLVILPDGNSLLLEPETSNEYTGDIPTEFALQQNYPNPFNPTTQISYALPEAVHVQIDVFNVTGQRVATLVNGQQAAGVHAVQFDASRFSSGVYLYRIQAGSFNEVRKMMLVK